MSFLIPFLGSFAGALVAVLVLDLVLPLAFHRGEVETPNGKQTWRDWWAGRTKDLRVQEVQDPAPEVPSYPWDERP